MKVLFLDIDGVLNNQEKKYKFPPGYGLLEGFDALHPKLVERYLGWLNEKDIEVILSSSWRQDERCKEYLNQNGIFWKECLPRFGQRGEEIKFWLRLYKTPVKFVILDDTNDGFKGLGKNWVQTSAKWGLRDRDLLRMDAILNA